MKIIILKYGPNQPNGMHSPLLFESPQFWENCFSDIHNFTLTQENYPKAPSGR